MTLVVPDHFDEIIGALKHPGVEVTHFTLVASRSSIEGWLVEYPGVAADDN